MRFFAISMTVCMVVGVAAAQRCEEISTVDFRNATIRAADHGVLRFRNGTFDSMESPGVVMWRWQIHRDETVAPAPGVSVRFLEILGDHLSGTGSRTYLIGFRCVNGAVQQVFQQAGDGMSLISLAPRKVTLRFGVWKKSDPHCCPSGNKTISFSWEADKQTYATSSRLPPVF
jgi:hypothetical protein